MLGACAPRGDPAPPAAPDESAAEIEGLEAPARIVTDRFGIPHLEARTALDLYAAWGWVTARDRLWQLERSRRGARGEMWQWLGNAALEADGGAQLFELRERAGRIWERDRARPEVREPLEAYARGINAYLAACRSGARPWPAEFAVLGRYPEDWRPEDSVLLLLAQAVVLDLDVPEIEEMRLLRERGRDWLEQRERFEEDFVVATIPDSAARRLYGAPARAAAARAAPRRRSRPARDPDRAASNAFAVGAGRGAAGKPLLANDPHLALTTPGPLHVVHLAVAGELEAAGAAVPGIPAIVSGRNRACAWGLTSLSADVLDVYADSLSADGRQVWAAGRWSPVRVERFGMRYRLVGLVPIPVPFQVRRYTPHGPVLVWDRRRRQALSARWASRDEAVTLARLLGIERSRSAEEVAERWRTLVQPCLNIVAADSAGGVVYQTVGALPRRGFEPGPGALPASGREWLGLVPPGEMPAWRPPRDGFVVNANNLPVGEAYPEPLPRFDWAHDRAARIAELLAADPRVDLADLARIQNDVASRAAARFVPRLLRCADSLRAELAPEARAALDTLRGWDHRAVRGRLAPTLFRAWYGALQRRSDLDGLQGLTAAALDGRAPEALRDPERGTPERPATAAVRALEQALAELRRLLGPGPASWTWERAHQAVFPHALARRDRRFASPPVPADGDNSTPCVGRSSLPWDATFDHGAAFRHVVDLAAPDSSLCVVAPGNSGDPASGHLRDHLGAWADHDYVPLHLDWRRIETLRESETRLVPRGSAGR